MMLSQWCLVGKFRERGLLDEVSQSLGAGFEMSTLCVIPSAHSLLCAWRVNEMAPCLQPPVPTAMPVPMLFLLYGLLPPGVISHHSRSFISCLAYGLLSWQQTSEKLT